MKYIVYKTTCLVNGKIYIGVHLTHDPNKFDGYLGRGFYKNHTKYLKNPEAPFHYALIKYGVENFKRETLFIYDIEEDAYQKEAEIVTKDFINREDTYNVALGGKLQHKPAKIIYQFDFDGNLINTYESALFASKILEVNVSNIHDAAHNKRTSCNSLWSYQSSIDVQQYQIKKLNKYYLYNTEGFLEKEFNNCQECVTFLETNTGNLSRAIKTSGKIKGYFISTEKYDKILIVVTKLSGKLNRYTLDGKYIDSFNTVKEAKEKLGLKLTSLSTAIRLNRQCNGFRWTRGDNPSDHININ